MERHAYVLVAYGLRTDLSTPLLAVPVEKKAIKKADKTILFIQSQRIFPLEGRNSIWYTIRGTAEHIGCKNV